MTDGKPELFLLSWGEVIIDGQRAEDVSLHCIFLGMAVVYRFRCRHPLLIFFFSVPEELVTSRLQLGQIHWFLGICRCILFFLCFVSSHVF